VLGVEPHIHSKGNQTFPVLLIATGQVLPALIRRLGPTKAPLQCCDEDLKAGPVHWSQVEKDLCRWPLQGQGLVVSSLIVPPVASTGTAGTMLPPSLSEVWLQRRTPIVPW